MKAFLIIVLVISVKCWAQSSNCAFPECECFDSQSGVQIQCVSTNGESFPQRNSNLTQFKISSLEFRNFNISQLPDSLFTRLSIKQLKFVNNGIESLEALTFNGIISLYALILVEPDLKNIDSNAFLPIRSTLRILQISSNLSDTTLSTFVDSFRPIEYLSQLNLDENSLTNINANLSSIFSDLLSLSLVSNKIRNLDPKALSGFHRISRISLDLNEISDLNDLVGSLEPVRNSLAVLTLNQNLIDKLVDFPFFPRLVQLSLGGNRISRIDATNFRNLLSLQILEMHSNRIETIEPDAFSSLFLLEALGLGLNRLTKVPQILNQINLQLIFMNAQKNLQWIDDYSFDRLSEPFRPLTIYLDGNDDLNFDNRAFCSVELPYIPIQEIVVSFSSALHFNKCFFKQLSGYEAEKTLIIMSSTNSTSSICNCEFLKFAAHFRFRIQGICDGFADPCESYKFKDDCSKEFDCNAQNTGKTSVSQTASTFFTKITTKISSPLTLYTGTSTTTRTTTSSPTSFITTTSSRMTKTATTITNTTITA